MVFIPSMNGGTAGGRREGASRGETRLVVGSWSELSCCQPDTAFPFLFSAQSCPHLTLPLSMSIQLTWLGFQILLFLSTTSHFLRGRISQGVTLNEASKVEQARKQVPQLRLVMYECHTKITW